MKNLPFLSLVVVFLAASTPFSAFCQEPTGTIRGVLLDGASARPLRGVPVRLIGSPVESKTDMKGAFTLTASSGKYAGLVANRPDGGFSLVEAELEVPEGGVEELGEIELTPFSGLAGLPDPSQPSPAPPPGEPGPPPGEMEAPPSDLPEGWRLHPWLGGHLSEVDADYGPRGGSRKAVVVARVFRASPAEDAGFEPGDVVEEVEGGAATGVHETLSILHSLPMGAPVEVVVSRKGNSIRLTPTLLPVPETAIVAIWDLADELEAALSSPAGGGPGGVGPDGPGQPSGGPVHPLLDEARRQASRGNFQGADRAYEEYLGVHPQDGLVWGEYAEMVYHNIQNARGMALMAQAVRKPGLHPMEKTRLRLLIAQRRLESGNLSTARQMLLEAKREDPFNPVIDDLLHLIDVIVLQASGQVAVPGQPVPYGARSAAPADARQVLVNELLVKIAKELSKD